MNEEIINLYNENIELNRALRIVGDMLDNPDLPKYIPVTEIESTKENLNKIITVVSLLSELKLLRTKPHTDLRCSIFASISGSINR